MSRLPNDGEGKVLVCQRRQSLFRHDDLPGSKQSALEVVKLGDQKTNGLILRFTVGKVDSHHRCIPPSPDRWAAGVGLVPSATGGLSAGGGTESGLGAPDTAVAAMPGRTSRPWHRPLVTRHPLLLRHPANSALPPGPPSTASAGRGVFPAASSFPPAPRRPVRAIRR